MFGCFAKFLATVGEAAWGVYEAHLAHGDHRTFLWMAPWVFQGTRAGGRVVHPRLFLTALRVPSVGTVSKVCLREAQDFEEVSSAQSAEGEGLKCDVCGEGGQAEGA